jgi:hypothetical protein
VNLMTNIGLQLPGVILTPVTLVAVAPRASVTNSGVEAAVGVGASSA